jgi:hypothetical protein
MALSYNPVTNQATVTFPGLLSQRLPDGVYSLRLLAGSIANANGKTLAQDAVFTFSVLAGDVNGDRRVDAVDSGIMQQSLLNPPSQRDPNNDLNGDGQVTSADLDIVQHNFGSYLLPTGRLTGDANNDGVVNDLDLFALWQDLSKPANARNLGHDLDGDGLITQADLDIVRANFRGVAMNGTAQSAPAGAPLSSVETFQQSATTVTDNPITSILSFTGHDPVVSTSVSLALPSPGDPYQADMAFESATLDLDRVSAPLISRPSHFSLPHWWKVRPRQHGFFDL